MVIDSNANGAGGVLADGDPPVLEAKALSWSAFVSTYLPALILATGTAIALPAIPGLAKSFHVSFSLATGVTTSFLIGSVAGTIPAGWLIDQFGRRRVMLMGPLLTSIMAFMVAAAHTFPELLIYRFIDGCAAQLWLMGRLAAISHNAAPNQRGKQVSWMFGMNNIGSLIGPLFGGYIANWWGLRAPFVAYGLFALVALFPAFMFTKDTPHRDRQRGAKVKRTISLRELVMPRLVYFGVAFFAALARGPLQAALLNLYAAYAYHLDAVKIGLLATVSTGVTIPISLAAGWALDRFGRKATMVPGFVGVAISMSGLAGAAYFHLALHWYVAILMASVAAQALTGGSIQTVGADVAPPDARGLFLGIWRFTGNGGVALSPVIFAVLAASAGYGASFLFIAAAGAVVAYLLIRHVPETDSEHRQVLVVDRPPAP